MVTVAVRTIGTGGDYTTIAAAEGDLSTILNDEFGTTNLANYSGGAIIEFHLLAGTHSLSAQQNWFLSGMVTDSSSYLVLKPEPGAENQGEFKRSGSAIIEWATSTGSNMFYSSMPHMHIEDLSFDWTSSNGQIVAHREGSTFTRCMMRRSNNATGGSFVSVAGTGTSVPLTFEDSTFEIDTPNFVRAFRWDNTNYKFTNCTLWNSQGTTNMMFIRARDGNTYTGTWTNNVINHRGKGTAFIQEQNGSTYTTTGSGNIERSNSRALPSTTCLESGYWTFTTDTAAGPSTRQAIWDEASLKLYDLTNNDAWQALTSLTGVNTTDIAGDTRSTTSGFNPGAFEEDAAGGGGGPTPVTGSGSGALSGLSGAGAGATSLSGSGAGTLSGLSGAGAGETGLTGSGTGTLSGLSGAGAGATGLTGSGTGTFSGLSGAGAGDNGQNLQGSGSGSLSGLSALGTGSTSVTGIGSAALRSLSSSGQGATSLLGSGDGTLSALLAQGQGRHNVVVPTTARVTVVNTAPLAVAVPSPVLITSTVPRDVLLAVGGEDILRVSVPK